MATAKVKIGVAPSNFQGIATLANQVITSMTGNANFPAPNPSLISLNAQLTILVNALATWGPVGNRGSHADYLALTAAALLMRNMLLLEADYVENQVNPSDPYATQAAMILTSGFSVKNLPAPQGVLNAPTGLIRRMSDSISEDEIVIDWIKPIGLTSPNNVKSYKIHVNGTWVAVSTKTTFPLSTVMSLVHGTAYSITVTGTNTDGDGVTSAVFIVNF